jgi:hypothetical protein
MVHPQSFVPDSVSKTEKGQLKGYLSMNRVLAESGIKKIPIGVKLQVTVIPLPLDLQHAN